MSSFLWLSNFPLCICTATSCFPGGASGKEPACQCRRHKRHGFDHWEILGGGHGNPLLYFCLENAMDRGVWWAIVHGVAKSKTPLKQYTCMQPQLSWEDKVCYPCLPNILFWFLMTWFDKVTSHIVMALPDVKSAGRGVRRDGFLVYSGPAEWLVASDLPSLGFRQFRLNCL